jgi:hypothetical protein
MHKSRNSPRLLEPDIKALLVQHLRQKKLLRKSDAIINEFTINKSSRRADLVIAKQKGLYAYEIKSEADSLSRLSDQLEKYQQFFDKVTVVASRKHIPRILNLVSQNTAVWEVTNKGIKIVQRGRIEIIRESKSFLTLMKACELRQLAVNLGLSPKTRKRKLLENMVLGASQISIREAAIKATKKRYQSSTERFWRKVGNKKIKSQHISELSPFQAEKIRLQKLNDDRKVFWEEWCEKPENLAVNPQLYQEDVSSPFGNVPPHIKEMISSC